MLRTYDANDAEKEALADWAKDSKGASTLARSAFLDGLFELADVWTTGVDPEECKRCHSDERPGVWPQGLPSDPAP